MVADPTFAMADEDLPRTLRRERAMQHEQNARQETLQLHASRLHAAPEKGFAGAAEVVPQRVVVGRFNVPFFHLVLFFIKALFAAIPALTLLGVLLFGAGEVLQTYFPELRQFELIIRIPHT
ncbi:MAG: hypothetical protein ACR2PG_13605 [Hyphomicrobiaceae bacterium]